MLNYQSFSVVSLTGGSFGRELLLPVLGETAPQLGRKREDKQAEGRGGSHLRGQGDWLLWGLATLAWVLASSKQWLSVKLTICLCLRSVSSAISAVRCCRLSCTVSRGRASPRAFSTVFFFFAHPPTRVFVFSGALGSSGGGYSAGSGSGERGFVQRVLARVRGREKSRGYRRRFFCGVKLPIFSAVGLAGGSPGRELLLPPLTSTDSIR